MTANAIAPEFKAFAEKYDAGEPQVLLKRIISDLETPVSAYLKLAGARDNAFLLESVEGGDQLGRYSIIGYKPDLIWRVRDGKAEINDRAASETDAFRPDDGPPLERLKALLAASRIKMPIDAPPMAAGVFGYLGYDIVREIERLPDRPPAAIDTPDSIFIRPTVVAVFDNVRQEIIFVATARPEPGVSARAAYARAAERIADSVSALAAPLAIPQRATVTPTPPQDISSNTPHADYLDMVNKAKEEIFAGEIFQVVLSQRFQAPLEAPPFELYRALRRTNPSPFLFYLKFDDHAVVGSSPEILVRVRNGEVTIRPIAGTRKRGATPEEDQALADELLADPKECAEHLMLLDLGRNDVGRAAAYGSVNVTESFKIERYSHVMHIVSNVTGKLADGVDSVDAVMAGFPAGTVTGAPKVRAMEIIDALERDGRGPYGGAIGYFAADGDVDTCIALRTAIVKDGVMHVQAGAGVVADSVPQSEYEECQNKAKALFSAAQAADKINNQQ
ncbi:MAG: anthranilate synthase component I [Pseudomonadota bacterium]